MNLNKKTVARMLRDAADRIENGTCGLDDEELISLGSMLMRRKMNIEQISQHFGVARITINRWQQCGKLPPFHKDPGGKDYLFLDEIEDCVSKWEENKD